MEPVPNLGSATVRGNQRRPGPASLSALPCWKSVDLKIAKPADRRWKYFFRPIRKSFHLQLWGRFVTTVSLTICKMFRMKYIVSPRASADDGFTFFPSSLLSTIPFCLFILLFWSTEWVNSHVPAYVHKTQIYALRWMWIIWVRCKIHTRIPVIWEGSGGRILVDIPLSQPGGKSPLAPGPVVSSQTVVL